jgi:hypothetical protein
MAMPTPSSKTYWHRWKFGLWLFTASGVPFVLGWECIRWLEKSAERSGGDGAWAWAGIAAILAFSVFAAPLMAYGQARFVFSQERAEDKSSANRVG